MPKIIRALQDFVSNMFKHLITIIFQIQEPHGIPNFQLFDNWDSILKLYMNDECMHF